MNIPSYARQLVSEPSLTLLPKPPKPPTPPTYRKRNTVPDSYSPKWAVGSRIAVCDYEKFGGMATTVVVQQVIVHTPRVYKRAFDPIPLYVVVYRDGTNLIVNEGALSAMAGHALKQNARSMKAPSANTVYASAQNANSTTAA